MGVQFGSKAVLGPNEAGFEVVDVLDESSPSEDNEDSDTVRAEIGPKTVPGVGEVGVEPPSIF